MIHTPANPQQNRRQMLPEDQTEPVLKETRSEGGLTAAVCPSRHLHSEHRRCDRSVAQWKVQQDVVQCLEAQVGPECGS